MYNVFLMNEFYGTHLAHLVLQKLKETRKPLAIREIALLIHIYDSKREQRNFIDRCRRAMRSLLSNQLVKPVSKRVEGNILITKYKLDESNGQTQKSSTERKSA